jgi:hypothetical protein
MRLTVVSGRRTDDGYLQNERFKTDKQIGEERHPGNVNMICHLSDHYSIFEKNNG